MPPLPCITFRTFQTWFLQRRGRRLKIKGCGKGGKEEGEGGGGKEEKYGYIYIKNYIIIILKSQPSPPLPEPGSHSPGGAGCCGGARSGATSCPCRQTLGGAATGGAEVPRCPAAARCSRCPRRRLLCARSQPLIYRLEPVSAGGSAAPCARRARLAPAAAPVPRVPRRGGAGSAPRWGGAEGWGESCTAGRPSTCWQRTVPSPANSGSLTLVLRVLQP